MHVSFKQILAKLTAGYSLTDGEIAWFIQGVRDDRIPDVQIAGFLVALHMKGATLEEIASIALSMRGCSVRIQPKVSGELMDTCGTGGGLGTLNISTATAIVAASAGIPIAKHGSRSISSLSGSADVLEALGVEINLSPQAVETMIEEIGIAFINAPLFNPVMGKVLQPESALGIKTIFYTIIGPLVNPAFAPRHLLGVYKPELLDTVAKVAQRMGFTHAMFVHGLEGLDEISLLGKTTIHELKHGEIHVYEVEPEEFGLKRCTLEEIKTREPKQSAEALEGVFSGRIVGPIKDAIAFNSAGALVVGGKSHNLSEGIALAYQMIESGAAERKLDQMRERSRQLAV